MKKSINQEEEFIPMFKPTTKSGYNLDDVASTLQKAIRRGDEETALFFALELFPTFSAYCWRRLSVIAVEDIDSPNAIVYVNAMAQSFFRNNDKVKNASEYKNRIFITKAVISLCREVKSREADHAQHYIDKLVDTKEMKKIPSYANDVHTQTGRLAGKTKKDFFVDEQQALLPAGGTDKFYSLLTF